MPSAAPPFDRAVALACTMQTLRGRWLYVSCACLASSSQPVRLILRDDPVAARSTLADVLVRLRCDTCKARPASVHLTETPMPPDVVGDVVPGWHLLLHGTQDGTEPAKAAGRPPQAPEHPMWSDWPVASDPAPLTPAEAQARQDGPVTAKLCELVEGLII